jgi:thiamine kinase-like enzyme
MDACVDEGVVIRDVSRRNRGFAVTAERGRSYLLKQGLGDDGRTTVAREAAVYEWIANGATTLRRHVPESFGHDGEVFLLDLLDSAEDLLAYHLRTKRFPTGLAAQTGTVLGQLHRAPISDAPDGPSTVPWVFELHLPTLAVMRDVSAAEYELIRILQGTPDFGRHFDDLASRWRPSAFIHADAKWDNWMVVKDSRGRRTVRLIDWEFAGVGDPLWDIGGVLGQ